MFTVKRQLSIRGGGNPPLCPKNYQQRHRDEAELSLAG